MSINAPAWRMVLIDARGLLGLWNNVSVDSLPRPRARTLLLLDAVLVFVSRPPLLRRRTALLTWQTPRRHRSSWRAHARSISPSSPVSSSAPALFISLLALFPFPALAAKNLADFLRVAALLIYSFRVQRREGRSAHDKTKWSIAHETRPPYTRRRFLRHFAVRLSTSPPRSLRAKAAPLPAQAAPDPFAEFPAPKPDDVKSIDAIMTTAVYDVISGPPGERDWSRFLSLFLGPRALPPPTKAPTALSAFAP